MKDTMPLSEWLPLIGLTVAAFIFNTSEYTPIGLLTDIAEDFQITEAKAGMLISAYSWVVTLLSLPLMVWVSKFNFRGVLLWTIVLFVACHALSAVASSYAMLMISRLGVACAHSIFWSIASPIAVRLVSPRHSSLAMSMVITGTSIAMIFGMPLGRTIGLYLGWRMTFFCIGAAAFLALVYLLFVFPKIPQGRAFTFHQVPRMLRNKLLVSIYVIIFLLATAYYTSYSYIEPFLAQAAGLSDHVVTIVMMIFGGAGLIGSFAFSHYYDSHRRIFLGLSVFGMAAALFLLEPSAASLYTIVLVCAFWGTAAIAFNIAFQAEVIKAVPQSTSAVAMSLFSGIFNLGIGFGTWVGGKVCSSYSVGDIGYVGSIIAVAALLYFVFRISRLMHRKHLRRVSHAR